MNMLKYACIYLDKQSSKYSKIMNVPDAVHSISHYTNYLAVIKVYQYNVKYLRWSVLQKE